MKQKRGLSWRKSSGKVFFVSREGNDSVITLSYSFLSFVGSSVRESIKVNVSTPLATSWPRISLRRLRNRSSKSSIVTAMLTHLSSVTIFVWSWPKPTEEVN